MSNALIIATGIVTGFVAHAYLMPSYLPIQVAAIDGLLLDTRTGAVYAPGVSEEIQKLQTAGFSDAEIASYVQSQREKLRWSLFIPAVERGGRQSKP